MRPGMKTVTLTRVAQILKPRHTRSEDSRRLHEIYEITLETLGIVRQLLAKADDVKALRRARKAERDIQAKIAASGPGNSG